MPTTLIIQVLIYSLCFALVWMGAGLVVSAVSDLSKSWKIPAFIISFFLLGILTSLPEITISALAVLHNDPIIVVGNLLGGVIVMFLLVIPLLGALGNGVRIPHQLDRKQLVMTLLVAVSPAFLTADQRLTTWEAVFMIILYACLFAFFSFRQSFWEKIKTSFVHHHPHKGHLFLKVLLGIAILIGASSQIVTSTLYFAQVLRISPFFISLIIIALGTNIPEISIIFRSILNKRKDIALADYLGSASANTLLMGIFTLMHGRTIILPNHFLQRFVFLALGLILFFFFARSKNQLSRFESLALLSVYVGFILFEFVFLSA